MGCGQANIVLVLQYEGEGDGAGSSKTIDFVYDPVGLGPTGVGAFRVLACLAVAVKPVVFKQCWYSGFRIWKHCLDMRYATRHQCS